MEWYCLVTLTDLQTRRAGLSASAELLVTDAMLRVGAVFATAKCPSVTASIVSKRLNLSENFLTFQ